MGQTEYAKIQKITQQARQRTATLTTKKNSSIRTRLITTTRKKTAYPAWQELYRYTKHENFFKSVPPAEVANIIPRYSENCAFIKKQRVNQLDEKVNDITSLTPDLYNISPDFEDSLLMLGFILKQNSGASLAGICPRKLANFIQNVVVDESKLTDVDEINPSISATTDVDEIDDDVDMDAIPDSVEIVPITKINKPEYLVKCFNETLLRLSDDSLLKCGDSILSHHPMPLEQINKRYVRRMLTIFVSPVDCPIIHSNFDVCTVKCTVRRRKKKKLAKKGYPMQLINAVISTFPQVEVFTKERINYEEVTAEDILYLKTMKKKPETARKFTRDKFSCFTAAAWYRAQYHGLIPESQPIPLPPYDPKKEKFDPYRRKFASRCVYKHIPMPPTVTLQLTPDWMDAIPEEYWPLAKQYMEFLEKQHDERILMEYDFHWEEYGEGRKTKFQNINYKKLMF